MNSFQAVNWVISNPHKAPVAGVALRGNSPGSTVTLKQAVPVYELPASSKAYKSSYDINRYIGRQADYAFTEYSLSTIDVPDFFDLDVTPSEQKTPVNAFAETLVVRQYSNPTTKTQIVKEPFVKGAFVQGRWKGYMDMEQSIDKTFTIAYQNIQAELIIDGKSVWRGKSNGDKVYQHGFKPGRHEVMLVAYPDEETKDSVLKVSVTDNVKELNYEELTTLLKELGDVDSFYCGVQNSIVEDQTVDITLKETEKPVVLFLTSYRKVAWDFENTNTDKLAAVVTSAKNKNEFIKNLPAHIPVYHYFRLSNTIHLIPDDGVRSIRRTFKQAALQIYALTGKLPAGFSGANQARDITVPEVILDREQYLKLGLADISPDYNIFIEHPGKMDIVFNPEPTRYIDYSSTSTPKRTKRFVPKPQRKSWAGALGVAEEDIPTGGFKAYYFDIFEPGKPKFVGEVNSIWIKSKRAKMVKGKGYVYEYGIEPENFGAFWIGKIRLLKDGEMVINLDSGNNYRRVLIDGEELTKNTIFLTKGIHTVEIEYVNDWHTYEFYFSITRDNKIMLGLEKFRRQVREKIPSKISWQELKYKVENFWRKI